MMVRSLFAAAFAGMLVSPASAQEDPALSAVRSCYSAPFQLTAEQRTLLCDAVAVQGADPGLALERLDRALLKIEGPSPAHAMLLGMRASALLTVAGEDEGLRAFTAALRDYPDMPPILAGAVSELTFTAHADKAADYCIRLAQAAPQIARSLPDYFYSELARRLAASGEHERNARLVDALAAIDYVAVSPASASLFARNLVDNAVRRGDLPAAREALRTMRDPGAMVSMLADEGYRELWPDIPFAEEGAREEVLREWITALGAAARDDRSIGGGVIRALVAHHGPRPVIEGYEPVLLSVLAQEHDTSRLFDFAFWVSPLASAHLIEGDVAGAEKLYRLAVDAMSKLDSAARFNAEANLALMLVNVGRAAEALEQIDRTIAALQAMDQANRALLPMHAVRVRSLFALGRGGEAWSSLERLRQGADADIRTYVTTMLRIGRDDEARDAIVAHLNKPERYGDAIAMLQPSFAAYRTPDEVELEELIEALATDPAVLAALEGKGRVFAWEPVRFERFDLPDLSDD